MVDERKIKMNEEWKKWIEDSIDISDKSWRCVIFLQTIVFADNFGMYDRLSGILNTNGIPTEDVSITTSHCLLEN